MEKENWESHDTRVYFGDGGIDICGAPDAFNRARLIASAPDLLEALEGLMALESRGRIMPIGKEWDKARAAIAAARGDL
jgi:hypothetical protein